VGNSPRVEDSPRVGNSPRVRHSLRVPNIQLIELPSILLINLQKLFRAGITTFFCFEFYFFRGAHGGYA
jgi:hypothetical protein